METINGALDGGYDSRDYMEDFAGNIDTSKYEGEENASKTFSNIKYNQNLVDKYSCTGAAAIGVISDVTGFGLPLSFRQKVWERQLETGAVEGVGDYLSNGMKQAVKLFNEEYPELPYKLEYKRIPNIKSLAILEILDYSSIQFGYRGSLKSDAQDNGAIDNNDNKDGPGHCTRIVKTWIEGTKIVIKYVDNYEGVQEYNIIKMNLTDNQDTFVGGYYIVKVNK